MMNSTWSESLKVYLRLKYGAQTQRTVSVYGKELVRTSRFLNHHHFNLRCLKSNLIPASLCIKSPVDTHRARTAAKRASRIFLQECVKTSIRACGAAKEAAKACWRRLQNSVSEEDIETIEKVCQGTAEKTFRKFKERQCRKFERLRGKTTHTGITFENPSELNLRPSWIVNMSDRKLSEAEESILSKGPKYAVTPRIRAMDIVAPMEAALRFSDASEEMKELSRIKMSEAIRKAKIPDNNISVAERRAYKDLRNCDDIKILQADKGKATVVMNAEDYNRKVHDLLDDRKCYEILRKDPTKATERKLLKLLRDLKKSQRITEAFYERVRPSEGSSTPARFFGRVKVHKESRPLRPVVTTRGSSTFSLSRKLAAILKPLVGLSGRRVKNTEDLVDTMREVSLSEDEILVSYDVKSLFTSIPINETIQICEQRLREDVTLSERTEMSVDTIIILLRFCLLSSAFMYEGQHYRQIQGIAMGSPVSPVLADISWRIWKKRFLWSMIKLHESGEDLWMIYWQW